MKFNQFGRTGLSVSEIGFGGSRIGGVFAGKNSSKEAMRVLHMALDSGINFYDTADMYAQGESESLIGAAFRERRHQVIMATKGGYCLPARRNLMKRIKPWVRPVFHALGLKRPKLPSGLSGKLSQDFSPAYLTGALEASLKRLQTDHVDIYQLHSPDAAFMQSGLFVQALQTLESFRVQGKIRHFGIATEIPEDAPFCLSAAGIASIQLGFGLLDPQAFDQGTLAAAEAQGLAVIARGCFGGGLLKENLDETELKASTPKWPQILALRSLSDAMGRPILDCALQFCRATTAVSVTLLGMHTEIQLRKNLRYVDSPPLAPDEYQALRSLTRGLPL
jgi:aryl-alcohol dehydrogenase-like predicted oxidoreductase